MQPAKEEVTDAVQRSGSSGADVSRGVRSAYDQIADVYATVNSGDMPEALLRLARAVACRVGRGARVLDVGCGVGRDMAWFEAQGIRMTGIDVSSAMLAYAARVVRGPLLLMDMRRLGFGSGRFDGVWCCASLLHLPKSQAPQALAAMHRVLKAGGALMVSMQEGEGHAWKEEYVDGVKRYFAYYRGAELEALLEGAGFEIYETDVAPAGRCVWLSYICAAR